MDLHQIECAIVSQVLVLFQDLATTIMSTQVTELLKALQLAFGAFPCDYEYRTHGAYCNNVEYSGYGAVGHPFRRMGYKDPDPR